MLYRRPKSLFPVLTAHTLRPIVFSARTEAGNCFQVLHFDTKLLSGARKPDCAIEPMGYVGMDNTSGVVSGRRSMRLILFSSSTSRPGSGISVRWFPG